MLGKLNKKYLFCIGAILTMSGCSSVANMVGYDTATMNESAAQNYSQIIQQVHDQKALDVSSPIAQRVHRVFSQLLPYANSANKTGIPFNWQMNVIRSDEMNAWAMPGGKMAVYTGMVEKLKLNDAEIAAVISHEMTHALLEHGKKALGGQILTDFGGVVLIKVMGMNRNLVGVGAELLSIKPFSRRQESEADAGGVRLMAEAGYNPEAAISVWEKMNKLESNNQMSILSTHPTNQARINAIRKMLPEVMPIYQKNKR
ncbi:M48 family metallopeptidase [Neisseria sp.]